MSNRFFISLLVVMALVVGGFAVFKQHKNQAGNTVPPTNHVLGTGASGVTLTEYGDFQCSACFQYEPLVQQVINKYKDQITFQFRNFPIVSKHPNAFSAARAAEAADKQGKFWEMHNKLYETQDPNGKTGWAGSSNPLTFFEEFATGLGLDITKFKTDFASTAVNDLINADITAGKLVPVDGTPTFQINGKKIENPTSLEAFNKLIDEAIAAKKPTTP